MKIIGKMSYVASAVVALTSTCVNGSVLYVDAGAAPGGDGQQWTSAFRFLQDALQAASQPGSEVEEVRMAQGDYRPDRWEATPAGTGLRTESFRPSAGLTIKGGFAGTSQSDPDARDTVQYPTVLNGDLLGDDGPGIANNGENSYHVMLIPPTSSGVVLDGLVVRGGNGNGPESSPETAWRGGGVRIEATGETTINNCRFTANWSILGGGLRAFGTVGVFDTVFEGNYGGSAAGMHSDGPTTSVEGCDFLNNTSDGLAAGLRTSGPNTMIRRCRFVNNQGPACTALVIFGSGRVEKCIFDRNAATANGSAGGAVWCHVADIEFIDCGFYGNTSTSIGGAVYAVVGTTTPRFINCVFSKNAAGNRGGAIATESGGFSPTPQIDVVNCNFVGNIAPLHGSAVMADAVDVNLKNCILWQNQMLAIILFGGAEVTVDHSFVPDENQEEINPMFFDPNGNDNVLGTADDRFEVLAGSPVIDAGNNTSVPFGVMTDFLGLARFVDDPDARDTGIGTPPIVDIGAYEHQPVPACLADIVVDNAVNTQDLLALINMWGRCPPRPPCAADIAPQPPDLIVGTSDLLTVINGWGPCR